MARDATARQRIVAFLADQGPLEDSSGRVTAALKEAVGYSGSQFGFSQLLTAMEREGQLGREIRGKRTYKVWTNMKAAAVVPLASAGPHPDGSDAEPESSGEDVDYDELAHALLRQAARAVLLEREGSSAAPAGAQRRARRLEKRIAELERELARVGAERDAIGQERDDVRRQLDAAVNNVEVLTERLNATSRSTRSRARDHLGSDERALLEQLTRRPRVVGA